MKPITLFAIALVAIVVLVIVVVGVGPLLYSWLSVAGNPAPVEVAPVVKNSSWAAQVETPQAPAKPEGYVPALNQTIEKPKPTKPKEMLEYFVLTEMMDENGAVRNIYSDGRYYVLAETTGQIMEYALMTDNKQLFDKEFELLQKYYLKNDYGLAYYSIWQDDYAPTENRATIDDNMRFLWVLYKAEAKWGGGNYKAEGDAIAAKIAQYCSYQNVLSKELTWDASGYSISKMMEVGDLRWEVMHNLSLTDKTGTWLRFLTVTTPKFLAMQGGKSVTNGLFWQEWNITASTPMYPPGANVSSTVEMLKGAMYFSDYKTTVPATLLHTRLEGDWKKYGKISSYYHMEGSGTGTGEENMETYALMGRNEMRMIPARCDLAPKMMDRILLEQITDPSSPIYGSVSQNRVEDGVEDDIDTLLFMLEMEQKCNITIQ